MRTINGIPEDDWQRRMSQALAAYRQEPTQANKLQAALRVALPERFVSPVNPAQALSEDELQQLMEDLRERFGGHHGKD
ncbi:MAG: hypothetical protein M3R24_28025 [Chloroflexota bacterium]|nr:hypothetical protein [Chloroflexota bacterium]